MSQQTVWIRDVRVHRVHGAGIESTRVIFEEGTYVATGPLYITVEPKTLSPGEFSALVVGLAIAFGLGWLIAKIS